MQEGWGGERGDGGGRALKGFVATLGQGDAQWEGEFIVVGAAVDVVDQGLPGNLFFTE